MTASIRSRACSASIVATLCLSVLALPGCQRSAPSQVQDAAASQPQAKQEAATEGTGEAAAEGVTLTAEQARQIGVTVEAAAALDYSPEIAGFGVVIPHDTVATAVAELMTAQAAQAQSRTASARAQHLAGTPGAMSADAVGTATRQVATDSAALSLAQRRLSSVLGGGPAGGLGDGARLQDLASGKLKLLRATFPLGALQGAAPGSLRAAPLDGDTPGGGRAGKGWSLHPVWPAPADATLPGRSFFAVLEAGDAGEGERLLVWAPGAGPAQHGAVVPASALVISDGRYWCYVERKPGRYVRREVATDAPAAAGYFVTAGIAAGDRIVTAAASLLLAREMNPSTEAD